ncbi:MAG: hypothetical protein WC783_01200 [Candidatus Paceibacterota bacterium]|jgi:hypothetical protein
MKKLFFLFSVLLLLASFPVTYVNAQTYGCVGSTSRFPSTSEEECQINGGTWVEGSAGEFNQGTPSGPLSGNTSSKPTCTATGIGGLLCKFQQILNSIIPVLVTLGVVYFVWGVVRYVIADGEEAKDKGREKIVYSIIGFVVIMSLWGFVAIIVNTFNLSASAPALSQITTPSGGSATCDLSGNPKFQDLACYITRIINNSVIPLIFALAVMMFVWGVVQFIIHSEDEAKKESSKQLMIWGIIGLTVMVGVWGLVSILGGTFGLNTRVLPTVNPGGK